MSMMPKTIRLQNVPDDLYAKLESKAALAGTSLSDYLLAAFHRLARSPSSANPRRDLEYERYERLRLGRADLREARSYLALIREKRYLRSRPRSVAAWAAYTAFVVSYSRPFSGNRDRGGGRVSRGSLVNLVTSLPADLRKLHDELLVERNTLIAHSDASRRQIVLVATREGPAKSIEIRSGVKPTMGAEELFERAQNLVGQLLDALEREIALLEPLQREKAEQHGSYPPPAAQ